jgi:hypothetical protein
MPRSKVCNNCGQTVTSALHNYLDYVCFDPEFTETPKFEFNNCESDWPEND